MENSKLLLYFKSFTPDDWRRFFLFMESPYFNKREDLVILARYLESFAPYSKEEQLPDKNKIHKQLFGKKRYEDKTIRYLLTDLTRMIEKFLVIKSIENDPVLQNEKLADELLKRDHEKAFAQVYRSTKNLLHQQPLRQAEFYLDDFKNEFHHYLFNSTKKKRTDKSNLESVLGNLDQFYLAKKLQLCCEIFNVQNILAVEYHAFLLEEIISYLKEHEYRKVPAIAIYYQILMTLREGENENHFKELLALLKTHEIRFPQSELRDMYQYALNYCIKQINLGNVSYQGELLSIFKTILQNGVLTHAGTISQWDYKNITTISLRREEYEWAREFINEYKSLLLPEERENAYNYNLANYHFHKGEWDKAQKILQRVSFTDPYYQLDSRSMLLKIYYEMDEHDVFSYHATAFLTYLRRNTKISEYQKKIYTNHVKLTSKLMRSGGNRKKVLSLKKQMEGIRQIADLNWLRKKVEELL